MITARKEKVNCDTFGCQLPVAYLKQGILIITTHHHGEKHTTALSLRELLAEVLDKRQNPAL